MGVMGAIGKGVAVDEALEDATRAVYPNLVDPKKIMAMAIAKLRQPDVCQAMTDAFAVCGFTMEDAIKTHIGHIQGTHTKEVVTKLGVAQVRIPPSYAALQGYQKLTIPQQTNKVQIEHTNLNEMLKTMDAEQASDGVMRVVGEIIDVEPEPDQEDIDPFEFEDEDPSDEDEETDEELEE
jgi:hypothetical protein